MIRKTYYLGDSIILQEIIHNIFFVPALFIEWLWLMPLLCRIECSYGEPSHSNGSNFKISGLIDGNQTKEQTFYQFAVEINERKKTECFNAIVLVYTKAKSILCFI